MTGAALRMAGAALRMAGAALRMAVLWHVTLNEVKGL